MPGIYSNSKQLKAIAKMLRAYFRLPMVGDAVPGAVLERVLAYVRGGEVLPTYDFVDVIKPAESIGWQIKSTKEETPVTWMRAKIPNAQKLIEASLKSGRGRSALGKAIIDFCNQHVADSITRYDLEAVGYARLIVGATGDVTYFERLLATREKPFIFDPRRFSWKWSMRKNSKKKEQLEAFHGYETRTRRKWFAWHGLGEDQLHFSGEGLWWPKPNDKHSVSFAFPKMQEKISFKELADLLKDKR